MFFNNVLSKLSTLAKGVAGLLESGNVNHTTRHVEPITPTAEALVIAKDDWIIEPVPTTAIEYAAQQDGWKECVWKYSDRVKLQISKSGKVRQFNVKSNQWEDLDCNWKNSLSMQGCNVIVDGKQRVVSVATMLLDTYVGRPQYLKCHRPMRIYKAEDGNEANCTIENLRWLTLEEVKANHARNQRAGAQSSAKKRAKKESEQAHNNTEEKEAKLEEKRTKNRERYAAKKERESQELLAAIDKLKHDAIAEMKQEAVEEYKANIEEAKSEPTFIDFNKAMREEVWVPIPKFEDAYEVSSFGNVRSIDRFVTRHRTVKDRFGNEEKVPYNFMIKGRRLKPSMFDGKLMISLSRGGKQVNFTVAKLVIAVFAKDKLTSKDFQVIHLNGNLNNCRLNNLRIVDTANR
ncbi:TPA: hypothetical protein U9M35_002918 [Acinetobacter baumannii]|nr:hypothetical protein [Acinetobacter baumannii]